MPRPISVTIHIAALANNLQVARRLAPTSKVWAVVKANAYGHGIDNVFPALKTADGFALLDLHEAARLRELGWKKPILLLEGFFDAADLELVSKLRLTTAVHCEDQLRMLEIASRDGLLQERTIDISLKLNSGMNRLGFTPANFRDAWDRLRRVAAVRAITHMTHFSDADGPRGIDEQRAVFSSVTNRLPGERCIANSAATLWHPGCHADWIRTGIMLYGGSPSGVTADIQGYGLCPTQTLASRILAVQDLTPGAAVGYGSQYIAPHRQRIGIVACGYADGYPRTSSSDVGHYAPVQVGGFRTRTVGRISMDMLAVDLTDFPQVEAGTPVELWGPNVPIDDVAAAAGTIGYELMCAVAPRVPVIVSPH